MNYIYMVRKGFIWLIGEREIQIDYADVRADARNAMALANVFEVQFIPTSTQGRIAGQAGLATLTNLIPVADFMMIYEPEIISGEMNDSSQITVLYKQSVAKMNAARGKVN